MVTLEPCQLRAGLVALALRVHQERARLHLLDADLVLGRTQVFDLDIARRDLGDLGFQLRASLGQRSGLARKQTTRLLERCFRGRQIVLDQGDAVLVPGDDLGAFRQVDVTLAELLQCLGAGRLRSRGLLLDLSHLHGVLRTQMVSVGGDFGQ